MCGFMDKFFKFDAKLWVYNANKATWHFATLPKNIADEIRFLKDLSKNGIGNVKVKSAAWGSIKVLAQIGQTTWQTSIFPDKNSQSYLLPIKAVVRKTEKLNKNRIAKITLTLAE